MRPELKYENKNKDLKKISKCYKLALSNLLDYNIIKVARSKYNRSKLFTGVPSRIIRAGGNYQTPWTRDAAINTYNAANLLAPKESLNTLWSVISNFKNKLVIQQDNQWWDQVIWIEAIWEHYLVTGNSDILEPAYKIATQTLKLRKKNNFNSKYGLYGGPAFFADGISGYPSPIGDSGTGSSFVLDHRDTKKILVLSTNCIYVQALRTVAKMAVELKKLDRITKVYRQEADSLVRSINKHLWHHQQSSYYYFIDPKTQTKYYYQESIGLAYAILNKCIPSNKIYFVLNNAHREPKGMPSVYPHFKTFSDKCPGRHNNIVWPIVSGVWTHALAFLRRTDSMRLEIIDQCELALSRNSFFEIYNAKTGAVDGGWQIGRKWKSCKNQTWSATAFIRSIHYGLFGLKFEQNGLSFKPNLPLHWGTVRISNLEYRNKILDITLLGSGSKVKSFKLNGKLYAKAFFPINSVTNIHKIEILME